MTLNVTSWLEQLGLAQYASAFRDNDIDGDVLPDLTGEDLLAIGVTSVGHRRKLLTAIAVLGAGPPAASTIPTPAVAASGAKAPTTVGSPHASAPAPASVPLPVQADAERRQLTVMFCDLAGWTALSARMDPEELRDLVAAFRDRCGEVIKRYEGFVAQYLGDGILAYFGYPRAHEDDAERSARAGLDIVGAMETLNADLGRQAGVVFAVRVGVATGPVVVGDLIGEGAAREVAVVGETPNLAARLQSVAQPNQVVVSLCAGLGYERTGGKSKNSP